MTLPITIHLTEDEAHALNDLLGWAGDTIGEILDDAKYDPEPDENDKENIEINEVLFNISQTVIEKIDSLCKPGACPRCGYKDTEAVEADEDDMTKWTVMKCPNCGAGWVNIFRLDSLNVESEPTVAPADLKVPPKPGSPMHKEL